MSGWLDRLRGAWDDLNDRERRLVGTMAVAAAIFLLGFPLFWVMRGNTEIEENNAQLRTALRLLAEKRVQLMSLAEARRSSETRYTRRTPPLGSFLEEEAKKHGLTIREMTDQPEKTAGIYHRRSVRASINDVGLTGVVDLLSGIEQSPYPVAVDHIQIEHYQPGDMYRVKVGVLTFDKRSGASTGSSTVAKAQDG